MSTTDLSRSDKWLYPQWKMILTKVDILPRDKILEIGSGFGGFFNYLKRIIPQKNYIGLELDIQACNFCQSYFNSDSFLTTSIENYKPKHKFDKIFAFEVLEHLENPRKVIEKIQHLLVPGGYFVGTSPYPFYKNIVADKTHLYVLHPENWKKLFVEAGFKNVQTYSMSFFPILWRISKFLNPRIPWYIPWSGIISTTLIIAKK
jgi:SAM-dependent methyltransferase